MSTTLTVKPAKTDELPTAKLPTTAPTSPVGEQRILLRNISWEAYETLLESDPERINPRLTYDRGTLELMSPLIRHEETNRKLHAIVETILNTWEADYRNLGSATFRRQDSEQGFEPDTCFYIQNLKQIGDRETVDLSDGDPPPDLVIEIDLYHSSLPKLPLFATFAIPEVWLYRGESVTIYLLEKDTYTESTHSQALPTLTVTDLNHFLQESRTPRPQWLRNLRQWAEQNQP
jgi:Uma2 family endonuclease